MVVRSVEKNDFWNCKWHLENPGSSGAKTLRKASNVSSKLLGRTFLYRVTLQVVPKLSIQGRYGWYIGPESRVSKQPEVSPCNSLAYTLVVSIWSISMNHAFWNPHDICGGWGSSQKPENSCLKKMALVINRLAIWTLRNRLWIDTAGVRFGWRCKTYHQPDQP